MVISKSEPAEVENIVAAHAPAPAANIVPPISGPAPAIDFIPPPPLLPPPPFLAVARTDDFHSEDDFNHEKKEEGEIEELEVDILVDISVDISGSLQAFGNIAGPQGLLRNISWITLDGNPIPQPDGPFPLARGYLNLL